MGQILICWVSVTEFSSKTIYSGKSSIPCFQQAYYEAQNNCKSSVVWPTSTTEALLYKYICCFSR